MKVSYNWLKEFVDIELSPDELADRLSMAGFEVEEVVMKGVDYPGVVTGKVVERIKHPNADRLSVCTVDIGAEETLNIVCGAPNVAAGQIVPVATVGTELPGGFKIRKSKIRGELSQGMICSEEELGLAETSEGIWVLGDDLPLGKSLPEVLDFETDYVIDMWVPPVRPDALSHIGIAREVAAFTGKSLKVPVPVYAEGSTDVADHAVVEIECPEGCPRYTAKLIRNIKLGPSPDWMARRLEAVGMRSINNIVDITNYVMLETGQPLHAFDYDLLAGQKIIVRESKAGEKFITLDDKTHKLQAGTVLICDVEKPVALGGIMGGLNSEVNDDTNHILLESASFSADYIRQSLRYLKMHSEASQRFARGSDPNGVLHAQNRAVELMAKYANGEIDSGVVDTYPTPVEESRIPFQPEAVNRLLGTILSESEMIDLLESIELGVEDGQVVAPTFRPDMRRTADVAEEVGRLYGYNNIPASTMSPLAYDNVFNEFDDFLDYLRHTLAGGGLREVVTNSMIVAETWEKLTGAAIFPIMNPINQEMTGMRSSLVPSLLEVVRWNQNRQVRDLAIFEIGRVFYHSGDLKKRPDEEIRVAFAMSGKSEETLWYSSKKDVDFYDLKGLVEYFADKIPLDKLQFIPYDNFAVASQAVKVMAGDQEIGFLGKIRPELQKHFDIDNPVFVADLSVQRIHDLARREKRYEEIPRYPWVERDLAIMVNKDEDAAALVKVIRNAGGKHLQHVYVFDVYSGKQVDANKKSVAFRLKFQSREKSLVDEEVNVAVKRILKDLGNKFQAKLRS